MQYCNYLYYGVIFIAFKEYKGQDAVPVKCILSGKMRRIRMDLNPHHLTHSYNF